MLRRRLSVYLAITLALAIATFPQAASAGCVNATLAQVLSHPDVVAVFRGVIVELKSVTIPLPDNFEPTAGQIATVRVTEVWKGDIAREVPLYYGVGDSQRLVELGAEYLFITSQLSAFGRRQFGVAPGSDQRLRANEYGCGVMPYHSPYAQALVDGMPGYPPR